MRILLTGATGFIGSAVRRLALQRGHTVAALVPPAEQQRIQPGPPDALHWLVGTLADAPWRDIRRLAPEVCVHTAWIATPGVYLESPDNHRFVQWSLDFLRRAREAGVRHIVVLGTCIEYQIGREPLSEDRTPIAPTTTYARCKNQLRLALEREAHAQGFPLCWGRVFYPYGVGEHPARLCSSIIAKLARGERVVLQTPDSTKDYIYVDDLANAILTAVAAGVAGALNLGTGVGVTVREIASTLGGLLGRPELIAEARPTAADPLGFVVADAGKLRALGWRPAVSLRQGLELLVRAVQGAAGPQLAPAP